MKRSMVKVIALALALVLFAGCNENTRKDTEHEHSFSEWRVVKEASCEREGLKEKICDICQKSFGEEEIIPATGHQWVEASCEAPKHCSVCNATEGEALDHNISGDHCTGCGKSVASLSTFTIEETFPMTYNLSDDESSATITINSVTITPNDDNTYEVNITYTIDSMTDWPDGHFIEMDYRVSWPECEFDYDRGAFERPFASAGYSETLSRTFTVCAGVNEYTFSITGVYVISYLW